MGYSVRETGFINSPVQSHTLSTVAAGGNGLGSDTTSRYYVQILRPDTTFRAWVQGLGSDADRSAIACCTLEPFKRPVKDR
jgi:hypothetical protein